eukprot:c8992_g1_i2.p1 GENE.c8992_g1_i2~~c8992_g1_i2.p1  ORF type:complete len:264 (+),score=65.24 c8992_g1_i2:42-833(+)
MRWVGLLIAVLGLCACTEIDFENALTTEEWTHIFTTMFLDMSEEDMKAVIEDEDDDEPLEKSEDASPAESRRQKLTPKKSHGSEDQKAEEADEEQSKDQTFSGEGAAPWGQFPMWPQMPQMGQMQMPQMQMPQFPQMPQMQMPQLPQIPGFPQMQQMQQIPMFNPYASINMDMKGYEKYVEAQKQQMEEHAKKMGFKSIEDMQIAQHKQMQEFQQNQMKMYQEMMQQQQQQVAKMQGQSDTPNMQPSPQARQHAKKIGKRTEI